MITTDLIFHYTHRDEGNYKDHLSFCVRNPSGCSLEQAEQKIRARLIDGEFFYARAVGMPASEFAESTDWHEFDRLELATEEGLAPLAMSLETLLKRLGESNKVHLKPIKVHKVPAGIPIQVAVSWLEFLRELRVTLEMINALVHKKSVVVVFKDEDAWSTVEETLHMDAQATNFDPKLRGDIARALSGMKEMPNLRASTMTLLRKLIPLQKRINRASQ